MTQPEHRTESFVVRVWLERREIADAMPEWRGVIEHVATGKRQYMLNLETVVVFMEEYMHGWGVKTRPHLPTTDWLHRFNPLEFLKRSLGRI